MSSIAFSLIVFATWKGPFKMMMDNLSTKNIGAMACTCKEINRIFDEKTKQMIQIKRYESLLETLSKRMIIIFQSVSGEDSFSYSKESDSSDDANFNFPELINAATYPEVTENRKHFIDLEMDLEITKILYEYVPQILNPFFLQIFTGFNEWLRNIWIPSYREGFFKDVSNFLEFARHINKASPREGKTLQNEVEDLLKMHGILFEEEFNKPDKKIQENPPTILLSKEDRFKNCFIHPGKFARGVEEYYLLFYSSTLHSIAKRLPTLPSALLLLRILKASPSKEIQKMVQDRLQTLPLEINVYRAKSLINEILKGIGVQVMLKSPHANSSLMLVPIRNRNPNQE